MSTVRFARNKKTGVVVLASEETDSHKNMEPCSAEDAAAYGIDISKYGHEVKATGGNPRSVVADLIGSTPAPKKERTGKKEKVTPIKVGQMLVTDETAPIPQIVQAEAAPSTEADKPVSDAAGILAEADAALKGAEETPAATVGTVNPAAAFGGASA